jgi:hypothetical protein
LLCALSVGCGGDGDSNDAGNAGNGGSGGTTSALSSVDCSDDDEGQTLICNAPEVCCAAPNAPNHCAESCDTTVVLTCDDDGDCPRGACCLERNGTSGAACHVTCDADFSPLCTRSSDCPTDLPCCLAAVYNGVEARFCIEEQDFACL